MKWLVLLLLPAQVWAEENVAVIYDGFGSRAGYVVEGRVIEVERRSPSQIGDGKGRNLLRNIRTLKNDEKEGVALTLQIESEVAQAVTDDEGFFRVVVKTTQLPTDGWHSVQAQGNHARGEGQLLLVPMENTLGIISDIDDTVLVSEVTSKRKLLKNTFLKNSLQRKTFPCTAMFYQRLLEQNARSEAAPVFYLSASPRQLTENLQRFLKHNQYPRGVLITKRVNGENADPLLDQQRYKIAKIEEIFSALHWVRFVLIGDDGERDPEIFQELKKRHPERIAALYIRKVNPELARAAYPDQLDLASAACRMP